MTGGKSKRAAWLPLGNFAAGILQNRSRPDHQEPVGGGDSVRACAT